MTDYLNHPGVFENEELVLEEINRTLSRQKAREVIAGMRAERFEPPELVSLRERLERPREPVKYRIHGYQPSNSRIICAAPAKAGIPDAFIARHMSHTAERARGDSTLRGWPDVEWFIVRESEDPGSPRYLRAFGRDVDQGEALLNYDDQTRHLMLTGGTRSDAKARALVPELVEVVDKADSPVNLTDLRKQLEGRKTDVSRASHIAENQGLVRVEIGPRNARLHYPISATGSGTDPRLLVPNSRNQSKVEQSPELIDQSAEGSASFPLVPTSSGTTLDNRFRRFIPRNQ